MYVLLITSLMLLVSIFPVNAGVTAGSFTNGNFDNWTNSNLDNWDNVSIGAFIAQENTTRHTASGSSAWISTAGVFGATLNISQSNILVANGRPHNFSVWVLDNVANTNIQISLNYNNSNSGTAKTSGSSASWQLLSVSVMADSSLANVSIELIDTDHAVTEVIYVDDASLVEEAGAFVNGNFDNWTSGNLDGWNNQSINGSFNEDNVTKHTSGSSTRSVRAFANGNEGGLLHISQFDIVVNNGATYNFSVWVLDNVADTDLRISLNYSTTNAGTAKTSGSNSNWQLLSISVIADSDLAEVYIEMIEIVNTTSDLIYFDDATLTETAPPPTTSTSATTTTSASSTSTSTSTSVSSSSSSSTAATSSSSSSSSSSSTSTSAATSAAASIPFLATISSVVFVGIIWIKRRRV